MTVAQPIMLLDEITDFLASSPTPQEIADFRPSAVLERRALDLLQRNRENRLSLEERSEMEEFMRMDHFMTLLKAKARLKLAG
ncbi:MAG: hypothetical protein HY866_00235 [Chloroflexi bacterium]|nr:hypothetical protein [Chloroflexota bacterium]